MRGVHNHYAESNLNKQYEQRTDCACVWVVLLSVLLLLKWLLQIWILCTLPIPVRVKGHTANTKCKIVQMSSDTARMYIFCNTYINDEARKWAKRVKTVMPIPVVLCPFSEVLIVLLCM